MANDDEGHAHSGAVPVPRAEPSPIEPVLQLPFDFYRTPRTKMRPACHVFPLAIGGDSLDGNGNAATACDARLAAAFGVLLFRYGAQPAVTFNASRVGVGGEPRWREPFTLSTGDSALCRSVLEQAAEFLHRLRGEASARERPERGTESGRAALLFVDGIREDASQIVGRPAFASPDDDLRLVISRSRENVQAAFHYDSSLFKRASIERFAGHLQELLAHIEIDPDAPISKLPLLPPAERRWLESVCDGRPQRAPAEFVHRSFERWAAAAPEATALRFRDQRLTYRALNSRANVLARHMTAQGIGAESRVVVCLEPSIDVAIVLLAVLKAGAVYVPLDPTYPAARIRASLEDIRPRLLVTRAYLDEKLQIDGVARLALDDLENLAKGLSDENPGLAVQPDQTAYIYYTSGTTGKPKGAAASQANLASYIRAARERYLIGASDVMPAIARFSFSISMLELMSPLAAGGTLVILERDHILDLDRMSRTLEDVTIFHAGPSLLKNLITYVKRHYRGFDAFSRVRHASSGGDMVSPEVLEGLKQIFFNAEVFVIYGCSEISCMGCTYPVARDRPVERTYVGRPFDSVAVRVLDSALNLLPVGVVGEIHFAGDGIVKGYLNRPELTAEKFIELDGRRYYRTGDMGRLSEDGWLEILGRSDFQVKLRGMRVELGEVEQHLRRAPGVRDGVVTARSLAGGEKALVAYMVLDRGGADAGRNEAPVAAVRRHMAENLPDYMVPSRYVELERLPLNHNMKVDRRALPEPEAAERRLDSDARIREPRTDSEKRLASLWMKLLGLDRIGLDDHFFDLGGHSVLGITLILDVECELGVVLTGMEVLRESLEGQAAICDERLGRGAAAPAADAPPSSVPAAPDDEFEAFHFGEGRSIYGVLCGAAGRANPRQASAPLACEAVLICPPIGQEHVRAHFILQRLARRLAAQGVPSLRFDYYGCGDSLGESIDATCGRWQRDIAEAHQELRRRTGATRIGAVGVRIGAALLGNVASELDLARQILWDPVCDGSEYCAEIAAAHETFIQDWRGLLRTPPSCFKGGTELFGLACSETNIRELKALSIAAGGTRRPRSLKWLATSRTERQARVFWSLAPDQGGSRLETMNVDSGWNDIARLGELMPDVGISTRLAAMATEPS